MYAGMRMRHRKGCKMYWTDFLSRHRPTEADEQEHVFVEPGRLFRLQPQFENDEAAATLLRYLRKRAELNMNDG